MNRLSNEHSAYLRSAAHQPVDWYPWGEEAFRAANELDKPILLDIGAVWCHWCHVMDMESYENETIARIINEHFIPVKVDRDERPDVDARYQAAVSAVSGQGGWPLTAFLLPDGRVFYGGTYFPPEDRHGRPGFPRVLSILAETYRNEREKVLQNAQYLADHIRTYLARTSEPVALSPALVDAALNSIAREHDVRYGGFGGAPKFPHPSAIELLLARYYQTGEQWMIDAVHKTLRAMAKGGIYDQLSGGFHRYSTDERWIVPHFEKMLYDNASLLTNYVHTYQATGDRFYKSVALDIIRYADEVLSDRERGGFYASQDADVEFGDDGSYFTWSVEQARAVLSAEEMEVAALHFNLYERGKMHHDPSQNVLFIEREPEEIASILQKPVSDVQTLLDSAKCKLLETRRKRKAPFVDTTVYAGWNGMMIHTYVEAYRAFGLPACKDFALRSLERILTEHRSDGGLITHRAASVAHDAFLDDQVHIVIALLNAFEVTAQHRYFEEAERIMTATIEYFWDAESGGFNDIPFGHSTIAALTMRHKPIQDSPTASGNATAVLALNKLFHITERELYREHADKTLTAFAGIVQHYGVFAATYFLALDCFLLPPPHIVVVSQPGQPTGKALHAQALSLFIPGGAILLVQPESADLLPKSIQGMVADYSRPAAYVCSHTSCAPPVYDPDALTTTLSLYARSSSEATA